MRRKVVERVRAAVGRFVQVVKVQEARLHGQVGGTCLILKEKLRLCTVVKPEVLKRFQVRVGDGGVALASRLDCGEPQPVLLLQVSVHCSASRNVLGDVGSSLEVAKPVARARAHAQRHGVAVDGDRAAVLVGSWPPCPVAGVHLVVDLEQLVACQKSVAEEQAVGVRIAALEREEMRREELLHGRRQLFILEFDTEARRLEFVALRCASLGEHARRRQDEALSAIAAAAVDGDPTRGVHSTVGWPILDEIFDFEALSQSTVAVVGLKLRKPHPPTQIASPNPCRVWFREVFRL